MLTRWKSLVILSTLGLFISLLGCAASQENYFYPKAYADIKPELPPGNQQMLILNPSDYASVAFHDVIDFGSERYYAIWFLFNITVPPNTQIKKAVLRLCRKSEDRRPDELNNQREIKCKAWVINKGLHIEKAIYTYGTQTNRVYETFIEKAEISTKPEEIFSHMKEKGELGLYYLGGSLSTGVCKKNNIPYEEGSLLKRAVTPTYKEMMLIWNGEPQNVPSKVKGSWDEIELTSEVLNRVNINNFLPCGILIDAPLKTNHGLLNIEHKGLRKMEWHSPNDEDQNLRPCLVVYYELIGPTEKPENSQPHLTPVAKNGKIIVQSTPPNAEIYLDNKFIGMTSDKEIIVPTGKYNVRVTKKGYGEWIREVWIDEVNIPQILVELEKE